MPLIQGLLLCDLGLALAHLSRVEGGHNVVLLMLLKSWLYRDVWAPRGLAAAAHGCHPLAGSVIISVE